MFNLNEIRQRAAARADVANPANPANWLIETDKPQPRISQLATLATLASEKQPARDLSEALADAINRCCDQRGDDDANRAGLLEECAALSPDAQVEMLAHFTVEAARYL